MLLSIFDSDAPHSGGCRSRLLDSCWPWVEVEVGARLRWAVARACPDSQILPVSERKTAVFRGIRAAFVGADATLLLRFRPGFDWRCRAHDLPPVRSSGHGSTYLSGGPDEVEPVNRLQALGGLAHFLDKISSTTPRAVYDLTAGERHFAH